MLGVALGSLAGGRNVTSTSTAVGIEVVGVVVLAIGALLGASARMSRGLAVAAAFRIDATDPDTNESPG